MNEFSKIQYIDLLHEAAWNRLPRIIGRNSEAERLIRICSLKANSNVILVGHAGSGKTSTLFKLAQTIFNSNAHPSMVLLDVADMHQLGSATAFGKTAEALGRLPAGISIFDDFGKLVYLKPQALERFHQTIDSYLASQSHHILCTVKPYEYEWIKQHDPRFLELFEVVEIKIQDESELLEIISESAAKLSRGLVVQFDQIQYAYEQAKRFKKLGALPQAAISLLDEAFSIAANANASALQTLHLQQVLADKTGVPLSQIAASETTMLKSLEKNLNFAVIGQSEPLKAISSTIKRAKLGLKNPSRPLGSFLLLGPSGVGKTETAKTTATVVFGKAENFLRIDMSEFSESHTVQRLIGSPPGYVGFDAGGEITNAIKKEPYSLLLLDEIEKANPKIFDIFLQVLDDGRLTSGQGETIDFTNTIIMATSNVGVDSILEAKASGINIHNQAFIEQELLPKLYGAFRPEFLNRFDAVLVFNPLSDTALFDIAKLEIKKIEQRVKSHNIRFAINPETLRSQVQILNNPKMGARPIKRFIEETCETLIADKLLQKI